MTTTTTTPIEQVRATLAAVDRGDFPAFIASVSDDVYHQFGNGDPTTDKATFVTAASEILGAMKSISHKILHIWEVEAGVVVALMDVTYTRLDGRQITLPCSNLFRLRGSLIYDYRVYMDINPVLVP
jgi:limonene-1,2-epoxide hydrolase